MVQMQKKNEAEDQIYEELVQAIPELPKMLMQMVIRVERFDSRQPQTELGAFKDYFASMMARIEKRQGLIRRVFLRLFQNPAVT